MLYKATTHRGHISGPGSYKPVQELKGGIGSFLGECITMFETDLNFIREHTGINQIVSGGDPNPEQSVAGSQMAVNATDNVLRPIYNSYLKVKKGVGLNFIDRVSLLIRHSKNAYEGYYPITGRTSLEYIKVAKDNISRRYGIIVSPELASVDKARVIEAAKLALQAKTEGAPGIGLDDFMLISRMVNNGNDRFAEVYLQSTISKSKKEANDQKQEMIKAQGEQQRETDAQMAKITKDKNEDEHNKAKDLITHETDQKIRLEEAKSVNDIMVNEEKDNNIIDNKEKDTNFVK